MDDLMTLLYLRSIGRLPRPAPKARTFRIEESVEGRFYSVWDEESGAFVDVGLPKGDADEGA